jgi:hypothetical protein
MKYVLSVVALLLASVSSVAQIGQPREITTHQTIGEYTVHYNVFHSLDIPASVAQVHGFVRGRDRALVNVSVTKQEDGKQSLGLKTSLSGNAKNLMQQQQPLRFVEVNEGDAVYYIAPIIFTNEDLLHFTVNLDIDGLPPQQVRFHRTLYTQ